MAQNMVELVSNIKNKPPEYPQNVNKISPIVEDVLRKMLTINPK